MLLFLLEKNNLREHQFYVSAQLIVMVKPGCELWAGTASYKLASGIYKKVNENTICGNGER